MKLSILAVLLFIISSHAVAQECGTAIAQISEPRPTGLNQVLTSAHFKIHYTITPDDPNETTTAYVNKVRDAAEAAWTFMYNDGWRTPPDDGDGYYDIYIINQEGLGTAFAETQIANGKYTSYITIINNLPANLNSSNCNQITYDERIQYLLAHEYGHACQFAYGRVDVRWFGENTSVFLEWYAFGNLKSVACRYDISGALASGRDPLRSPNLHLNIGVHGGYSYQMYTGGLWPIFLEHFYGSGTVRNIWEYFAQHPTEEILPSSFNNSLAQNQSSSLAIALQQYAVWRYFTGSRDDGQHFDEGNLLPEVPLLADYATQGSISGDQGSVDANKINGLGGAQYIQYKYSDGTNSYPSFFDVTFDGADAYTYSAANISVSAPLMSSVPLMSLDTTNLGQTWVQIATTGINVLVPVSLSSLIGGTPFNYTYSIIGNGAGSVTFKNELSDLSDAGGTLTLQRSTYTNQVVSNTPEWIDPTKYYTLKTDNESFTNGQIRNKHMRWNDTYGINILKRTNYVYSDETERAQFNPTRTVVIGNAYIDKPTIFADKIKFHDPWYLKDANFNQPSGIEYIEYDSPMTPTGAYNQSSPGVFPRIENPLFPNYNMQAKQNISGSGYTGSFMNWSVTGGANVTSPTQLTTNATFLNNNDTIRALYKAQLATGDPVGYNNSGQRKVIRTPGGYIHMVYASAGKIWYEIGVEESGGITWYLMNGSQPINGTTEAKSPSITSSNNKIVITYQEKFGSNNYKIVLQVFALLDEFSAAKHYLTSELVGYSTDAHPVVSLNPFNQFVAIWKQSSGTQGLYYYLGAISSSYQIVQPTLSGMLSGTTSNSLSPTVDANRTVYSNQYKYFQCAYTHGSAIHYRKIFITDDYHWAIAPASDISYNSGYTENYSPSIITWGNFDARVAWIGKRWEEGGGMDKRQADEQGAWVTKTLFKNPAEPGTFFTFEQSVNSVQVQKNIDSYGTEVGYLIGWSALYGTNNRYVKHTSFNPTRSFGINGENVQIIGGESFSNTYGTFLNYTNPLFKIERSSSIQILGKEDLQHAFSGREGIVAVNDAEVFFTLGDIQVDGEIIEFKEKHDTLDIDSEPVLNEYLTTDPFMLTDGSHFQYSIQYGFTDSSALAGALTEYGSISFNVELIDHSTGQIIGSFDKITYTPSNLYQYKKTGYIVNTEGIGTKMVRLRLVVHSNIENSQYALNTAVSSESVVSLGKQNATKKQVNYKGTLAVDEYALDQNFPNPFNPVTTISYALPQDGIVTLKIYDALGREVSTLVNEFKQTGRYTASFDASKLSSGVYIYKLTSGKYSANKKMMLVK